MYLFKFVYLIDLTTLWQEFIMHRAFAIERNSQQNLHIWPNLTCFFRSWLIGLWLECHSHTPTTRHQLWPFWANMKRCPFYAVFALNLAILKQYSLPHVSCLKTSVKTSCHKPNDMPTLSATSLTVIQRLSKIISFTATMFPSVVDVLIDILSAFHKPVIPQLNLCSAYSRHAKRHSQHFKCLCTFSFIFYTKLNTVSKIHFFEYKKSKSIPNHD